MFRILLLLSVVFAMPFAGSASASDRFVITGDGSTFLDKKTNIEWMRCSYGDKWDGKECKVNYGSPKVPLDDMIGRKISHGSHDDWRAPTVDELKTLVFCSAGDAETKFVPSEEGKWSFIRGFDRDGCKLYHQNELGSIISSFPRTRPLSTITKGEVMQRDVHGATPTAWSVNINTGQYYLDWVTPGHSFIYLLMRDASQQ